MTKLFVSLVLLALCACAGSNEAQLEDKSPIFSSEKSNPYTFNRAVAYTLLRTNQPMEASRVIKRMLEVNSDTPEPYYMLGRAYLDMRQFEPAQRALATALHKDGTYAPAQSTLGLLLDMQGRHEEAELRHKLAIELDPKNAGYRNNLGFSYYLRGQFHQAVAAYEAGLERDMADRRIHNNLGFAYGKLGQLDKAEEHFQFAGPPAQSSNNLGFVHEERGDLDTAYKYYLLAVNQDPLLVPARDNLKRVCESLGRPVPEPDVQSMPTQAQVAADATYSEQPKAEVTP